MSDRGAGGRSEGTDDRPSRPAAALRLSRLYVVYWLAGMHEESSQIAKGSAGVLSSRCGNRTPDSRQS